jgi:hypothetical protein
MSLKALILLQVDSLSTGLAEIGSGNILSTIETIIVLGIIFFQLIISYNVYLKVRKFSNIFSRVLIIVNGYVDRSDFKKNRETLEDYLVFDDSDSKESLELIGDKNVITIPYVVSAPNDNDITQRIVSVLNSYLINNFGAIVNFSIIKDILEREVDLEDSEISNSISTPLYLGLAATMLGVIMGLFAMPDFNGVVDLDLNRGVGPLINGVKLAMFASLAGLLCTTILSSFIYKHARTKVNHGLNSQISYFQNKLLPVLIKAEDTGVSGLKASLDKFGRETAKILEDLHGAVDKTSRTLSSQLQVISKVENLNFTKVSKVNLELFDRLEVNMNALNSFSQYLNQIDKVAGNLYGFSERSNDFKKIADAVNENLTESKLLTQFLTSHLQAIQSSGSNALNAFNLVDSKFADAISKLSQEVDNRMSQLNQKASVLDVSLIQTFDTVGEQIQRVSEKHLQDLSKSYTESMPEFKNLEILQTLPGLKETMDNQLTALKDLNATLVKVFNNNNNELSIRVEPEDNDSIEIVGQKPNTILETPEGPAEVLNEPLGPEEPKDIVKEPWYKFW